MIRTSAIESTKKLCEIDATVTDQQLRMTAIVLAGQRDGEDELSEYAGVDCKAFVEIGGKPILWHIMKIYSAHGINDFIICCG